MQNYREQAKIIADTLDRRWLHTRPFVQWGSDQNNWNSFNTVEALIDYTQITGDRRYIKIIRQAITDKSLVDRAMHDGVDDEAWCGIAQVKAFRLLKEPGCLEAAKAIFANMTTYWDDTCKGGVWWNFKRTYKNAITNELFLTLATMLYRETREASYLDWAKREWEWFLGSGMINAEDLVNDGLHECRNNGSTTWTYNQGVVLGGLHGLYDITGDKAYLDQAGKIVKAAMDRLSTTQNGLIILVEPTGNDLNSDQQQFKGIFLRYLAALMPSLPESGAPGKKSVRDFVAANASAAWNRARTDANEINAYWHECDHRAIYNGISQTSALDLFNAAVLLHR